MIKDQENLWPGYTTSHVYLKHVKFKLEILVLCNAYQTLTHLANGIQLKLTMKFCLILAYDPPHVPYIEHLY
jgi:hypothetical protein